MAKQKREKIIDGDIHDLKFLLFDPSTIKIHGVEDDYLYLYTNFIIKSHTNENDNISYKFLLKMRIAKYNYLFNLWIEAKRDIFNYTGHFCGDFGFFYSYEIKVHESKLKLHYRGEEKYEDLPVVECEFDDICEFSGVCDMDDESVDYDEDIDDELNN